MLRGFLSVAAALLCLSAVCVAQRREVEGSVSDAEGRPVPFATVTASSDSAAAHVMAYAVAAADGGFKVMVPDASRVWWLTARSVGFRPARQRLTADGPLFVRFRLAEDRQSIADVVVTGATFGVKVGNDTVRFNPAAFKTGGEQSLADVISKLPGVAVQSDGSMTFRGKKIDKFLVDGKEALSGGGSTKTLPPDFAESIEMLENYSDGNVADAFSTRRQTAMNLKTDGSRQTALYASAAGGLKDKFDAKGSAFMFGRAGSASATANANNTGEAVFSMMDYINASGGISNVSENVGRGVAVTLSNEEAEILAPSADEDRRLSVVASANANYEGLRGYGVGVSLVGHAMGADAHEAGGVVYHLPGGGVFSSTSSADDKASRLFAGFVNQKLDRRGLMSLRAKTKFLWGRSSDDSRYLETRDGVVADFACVSSVRSVGVEQGVSLSLRLDDHLLYAEAAARVRHATTRTEAAAGRDLPAIFARGATYGQERENDEWGGGGSVGAIWMLFRGVGLKGEASFTADRWRLRTDDGQPAETLVNRDAGFYMGLSKGKGQWQFDAGARWAALWRAARIDGVGGARRGFLAPSLRTSWEFSKSSKLAASISYGLDRRDMSVLSRKMALLGHDEVRRPSEIADAGAPVFDATLFYSLISQFSRVIMMYAMATYSKTSGEAVAEYTTDGMVSAQAYVGDDGSAQEASLRFYVNKGVASLPLELRVSSEFEVADGSVASAGRRGAQETLSANGSMGITSRFRSSPVNATVSGSRSWARSEIGAFGIKSDAGAWRAAAGLTFSRGAFVATLTGKWGLSVNDSESLTVRDADFEAAYKWRRLTFKLTGVDVCHLDGSDWLSKSANPNRTATSRRGQMPGRVMAGVAFNK